MAHKPTVFSPEGTPLLQRTVGELVAENPSRSRVFQKHSIGFCCQGSTTLTQACESKNLDPETIAAEIKAADSQAPAPVDNPAGLPPHKLTRYLIDHHHQFLRDELPRIHAMAERVAQVHGGNTPSLVDLYETFTDMARNLADHVVKEEKEIFPHLVETMEKGEEDSLSNSISFEKLEEEHRETLDALSTLRTLTNHYQPPEQACNTYRALFSGLRDLEEDLHRHLHLESAVLFPSVQKVCSIN